MQWSPTFELLSMLSFLQRYAQAAVVRRAWRWWLATWSSRSLSFHKVNYHGYPHPVYLLVCLHMVCACVTTDCSAIATLLRQVCTVLLSPSHGLPTAGPCSLDHRVLHQGGGCGGFRILCKCETLFRLLLLLLGLPFFPSPRYRTLILCCC